MKKLFTLLWFALAAFTFKATAQTTTCNANFTAQFLTNTTVKFNPAQADTFPVAYHTWTFGDGSPVSHNVSPTHTYAVGTYAVVHTIVRTGTSGGVQCTQSFTLQLNIQECNLVVDFSWTVAAGNPLTYAFQNLSTPLSPTDSITWIFGDNTTSHDINPTHTYANYGTYTVCLIVKKNPGPTSSPCIKYTCKTITITQPCNLVVDFSWTISTANPLTYVFQNHSTPLSPTDSTIWNFGDGTTSLAVNPTHTYANAGTYNVCLIVKKLTLPGAPPCVRYLCKTLVVPPPCILVVDFSWNTVAANPLTIAFTNLSTPLATTDSITWTFGDGTSSHDVNPTHTYATGGSYNVCLIVKKSNTCMRYICKTVVVQTPCTLVANFTWQPSTSNPLGIYFTNTSTGAANTDSVRWTFGDGTSANTYNAYHAYAQAGTYTVCLRMQKRNSNGTLSNCISEKCNVVVVQEPCTLVVDFSWNISGPAPAAVAFTNLSTPLSLTDSITWTFGDGSTSNAVNPTHTYTAAGTYTVCLRVKKNSTVVGATPCIREVCKTIVIQQPCNLVVDFSWNQITPIPLTIHFNNLSTPLSPTDSITWTFGDGTSSHDVNPTHTYANAGSYNVCLIVKKNDNPPGTTACIRYTCKTVVVQAPCTLVANFTWQPSTANAQGIYFTNTSTGANTADSVRWTFGDGTSANTYNAYHAYAQAGTYTVCLRMQHRNSNGTLSNCVSEKCNTVVVQPSCNFQPSWTWALDSANVKKVYFTNTTTVPPGTGSAMWFFGDGTSANTWNAIHEYANPGRYYVCLRVEISPNCVRYKCDSITVPVPPPPCTLVANFTWQPSTANAQGIYFTNTSTGATSADSVRWTFGDGTSANTYNAYHVYAQAGTYTVCLRMQKRNNNGTLSNCVSEKCSTIVVQPACNFQPSWTWHLDSANVKKVYFTNTTSIPTATGAATWFFGDGTSATTWNAVHEYANPGRYYVCLRVEISPNCVRYKCDSITVPVPPPPCNNQSNFTIVGTTASGSTFTFVPAYQNSAATYTWTFGDGTGSNAMVATHHYTQAGTYTVCLTVWRSVNCVSTTCKTVVVTAQINCDSIHVGFTYQHDPYMPNKLYFYANANFPILDQTWTITRLPASTPPNQVILHANNPSYVFNDTGYYRVCLRAVTLGGCIKEYCTVIHIEQVAVQCQLTAYPNPASTEVHINVPLTAPLMINVFVYNNLNVLVLQKQQQGVVGNNVVTLNIAGLVSGYYTVRVIYGNNICNSAFQKL